MLLTQKPNILYETITEHPVTILNLLHPPAPSEQVNS